jgi:hypothetical protein
VVTRPEGAKSRFIAYRRVSAIEVLVRQVTAKVLAGAVYGMYAPLSCQQGTGGCSGVVEVQTTSPTPRKLGSRSFSLRAGQSRRFRVPLSRSTLGLVGRRGLLVRIVVRLRGRVGGLGPLLPLHTTTLRR